MVVVLLMYVIYMYTVLAILGDLYYITTHATHQRITEFFFPLSHCFIVHVPNFIQSCKRFIRICYSPYKVGIKIGNANYTNLVECRVDSVDGAVFFSKIYSAGKLRPKNLPSKC